MGDTMFSIFGNGILETGPRKANGVKNVGENTFVGKNVFGIKTNTPAKFNKNAPSTPCHADPKKKTFLNNEGAPIQTPGFDTFKKLNSNVKLNQPLQTKYQVYEDAPIENKKNYEDMHEIDFNRKPMFCDDFSDDEFQLSKEQIDKIAFGLPKFDIASLPKIDRPVMRAPSELDYSLDDILKDELSDIEDLNCTYDDDLPIPEL